MDPDPSPSLTVNECIEQIAKKLNAAHLHFGHGAIDANSEPLGTPSTNLDLSQV